MEPVQHFSGDNNREMGLSVSMPAGLSGCNKNTAAKAYKALEGAGFIERTKEGAFSDKKRRSALYRLTHLRADISGQHTPVTSDFKSWKPDTKKRDPGRGDRLSQSPGPQSEFEEQPAPQVTLLSLVSGPSGNQSVPEFRILIIWPYQYVC